MTITQIHSRIFRSIEIQRAIAAFEKELKEHKTALVAEAESNPESQVPTEGGGWSWTHQDLNGNVVRVTKPGRKIKSKIDPEAATFAKIKEAAGRFFMELFMQTPSYKPVEEFQVKALARLDKSEAKKLIKLVTTESAMSVNFEVKENA